MREGIKRPELSPDLPELRIIRSDHTARIESEFAHFFAQSLDLFCIAGFDGYVERANPAWTTQLGWRLEELRARPFIEFVHPDDRETTLALVSGLSQGASASSFENRHRHRDGTFRWLQWHARAVPGRARIYAAARDITDFKRLHWEASERADSAKAHLERELHDGLCQTLAGIAALSMSLARRLPGASESSAAAEIARLLNETIREARQLARGRGPIFGEAGLRGALETLSADTQRLFCVACVFECHAAVPKLDEGVETHLFRIAQQAVNNALTHGRAQRIDIRLQCREGRGLLRVSDDGVGLPQRIRDHDGVGLRTMAYRAYRIGGALEARRRAKRGTSVTCRFPLDRAPPKAWPCA